MEQLLPDDRTFALGEGQSVKPLGLELSYTETDATNIRSFGPNLPQKPYLFLKSGRWLALRGEGFQRHSDF